MASEKRQPDDTLVEYVTELLPDETPVIAPIGGPFPEPTPRSAADHGLPTKVAAGASKDTSRLAWLIAHATESDFFSLVARLEDITRGAVRVGGDGPVNREALRFRHDPSMAFSTTDVSGAKTVRLSQSPDDPFAPVYQVTALTTTFLGLTGSSSPLPLYLASDIAESDGEDTITRAFLDVFHHRLVSLFYRLWIRYQYAWESRIDPSGRWSKRVLSLGGFDTYDRAGERRVPLWKTLRVIPLLLGRARPAYALRTVIKEYLRETLDGAEVEIVQFIGGWALIAKDQQMALGQRNCTLAKNALIGTRIYDRADRFLVRIGPINADGYRRFTSDKAWLSVIREAVELAVRVPMAYDIELVLSPDAKPGFTLSSRPTASLGRDTWLSGQAAFRSVRIAAEERPDTAVAQGRVID